MDSFKFDQLPDLCLRKIFALLNVQELVKCRAVNGLFKSYADGTQITELAVCDRTRFPGYGRFGSWYQTERTIDFQDAISPKVFERSPIKLREQLKFLYIDTRNSFEFAILNDLKQLVHLEFESCNNLQDSTEKTLVLPNLRVLCGCGIWLVLNTPKLEVLRSSWLDKFKFKYPETIKRVECANFDHENLTKLNNLKSLNVWIFKDTQLDEVPDHLSNLPSLNELLIEFNFDPAKFYYESNHEKIRSSLTRIVNEKAASKRDNLKIFLNDLLLIDGQLPNFEVYKRPEFECKADLEEWCIRVDYLFRFVNYRLVRYIDCTVEEVDFCELASLNFEISSDFFKRFPQIRTIIANNTVDREQFEWFLQNATELRVLKLTDTGLDQAFFDRLPKIANRLTYLRMNESFDQITDFRFLLQLERLAKFETDHKLHSFDLAATAFGQLQNLNTLRFRTNKEVVEIERPNTAEDDYSLQFFAIRRNKAAEATFIRKSLRWYEVATLYTSRTARPAPPTIRMRVKRPRFE